MSAKKSFSARMSEPVCASAVSFSISHIFFQEMANFWKRPQSIFSEGDNTVRYIENGFISSVGSAGMCDVKNCNRYDKILVSRKFCAFLRSTEKLRHLKKNDGTLEIWRCEICTIEGKGFVLNSHTEHWVDNDSTFKCPASECAAVNQTFRDFFQSSCCEDNKRRKKDFGKIFNVSQK